MKRPLLLAAALLLPLPALAHAGAGQVHGLASGFVHPLGGLDHLAAMVAAERRAACQKSLTRPFLSQSP